MDDLNIALSNFSTIYLAEMDRVRLMNRVETKFVFKRSDFPKLLTALSADYRIVKIKDDIIHAYESLYFDDKNLFLYNEHHRGRQNRFKIRYRRYVESNLTFFEIKHKRKGRTSKHRIQVNQLSTNIGKEEKVLLDSSLVPQLELQPSISNTYKRITLVNKTSVERLTFDIDLSFKIDNEQSSLSDIVIAELKQERITRTSPFYLLAKKMHLRPFRLSKYCTGLIQLNKLKDIKYNRFKKKILQLNKLSNYGIHVV